MIDVANHSGLYKIIHFFLGIKCQYDRYHIVFFVITIIRSNYILIIFDHR